MTPEEAHILELLWRAKRPTLGLLDTGHPGCADGGQQGWVRRFRAHGGAGVWNIARQRGKSFAGLVDDFELNLDVPGSIVRFAAKTAKSARAIVEPTMAQVLETCPADMRPRVDNERGLLEWPNGSSFVWAGVDSEQFDRLRGPRAHRLHFTEVGFWDPGAVERVEGALLPQLTTTGGQVLYESSPPESPGHPFVARFRAAQATGRAECDTIEGNPRLTAADVQRLLRSEAERLGMTLEEFRASTYCRREFYAEIVTEESRAAVPGWTPAVAEKCVGEWARPKHFDALVAVDWGSYEGDPHFVLFGHTDFASRKLVIEDEIEMRGGTLRMLFDAAKQKERELWGVDGWTGTLLALRDWQRENIPPWLVEKIEAKAPRQPYLRVCDNDLALAVEALGHGVALLPSEKHEKHIWLDALDSTIRRGGLLVHSRCKRLREQLMTTVWNKQRTTWERTSKDHGDGIDALYLMHRNAPWNRDPRPPPPPDPWFKEVQRLTGAQQANPLASLFTRQRR